MNQSLREERMWSFKETDPGLEMYLGGRKTLRTVLSQNGGINTRRLGTMFLYKKKKRFT